MDDSVYRQGRSPLHDKSYAFAVRIINMVKYIDCPYKMNSLMTQIFKSGTAIGALIREAQFAQSSSDFINKLHIALKECNETSYWLSLLHDAEFIGDKEFTSMSNDCNELLALLISSIRTSKERNNKQ